MAKIILIIFIISTLSIGCNRNVNKYDNEALFDRDLAKIYLPDSTNIYSTYRGEKGQWSMKINPSDIYWFKDLSVDSIGFLKKESISIVYNKVIFYQGRMVQKLGYL